MKITPVIRILLILNGALFVAQMSFGFIVEMHLALWPWGSYSGQAPGMGVVDVGFMPWQLLSYGFLHGGFFHLFFNMFALFMFGSQLEDYWGSKPFALYFVVCVIGAGLIQLVVATMAASSGSLYPTVGASGGVFGILLGFGMMFPHQRVMLLFPPIPMPAWLMVTLFGAFELYMGVTGTASGIAHFAHLGGMLFGFVMIQYWRGLLPIKPKRTLRR